MPDLRSGVCILWPRYCVFDKLARSRSLTRLKKQALNRPLMNSLDLALNAALPQWNFGLVDSAGFRVLANTAARKKTLNVLAT